MGKEGKGRGVRGSERWRGGEGVWLGDKEVYGSGEGGSLGGLLAAAGPEAS